MFPELYQYLLRHKELPVPGIGTFLLQRNSAVVDFPNKCINPPSYQIAMKATSHMPGQPFFNWLGRALGIGDRDAIFRFNDFVFDLKKQVNDGATIEWQGVGSLKKNTSGDIHFTPIVAITTDHPVTAHKIIRQHAEHTIRVGEDQRTSVEMTEMLSQTEEKKSTWWIYAAVIALLAVIFIGWYFSEHGVETTAVGNNTELVPMQTQPTYTILPE